MPMTLTSSNRTMVLPEYMPGGLKEIISQGIAKTVTIGGRLSVDVMNIRGGYRISFDIVTESDWQTIKALWDDQINNNEFLVFNDTELGRSNWHVWLSIPEERDLRWNKNAVQDLTIIVEPKDADS